MMDKAYEICHKDMAIEKIKNGFLIYDLPVYMENGVTMWVLHGHAGGGFLMGLLENNLCKAVLHADGSNKAKIVEWVRFLMNHIPFESWGSKERINSWKGLKNYIKEVEATYPDIF